MLSFYVMKRTDKNMNIKCPGHDKKYNITCSGCYSI